MPRIDTDNFVTRDILLDLEIEFDPGDTLDVCRHCYERHFAVGGDDVAHPPYENWLIDLDQYTCCVCGEELTEFDN